MTKVIQTEPTIITPEDIEPNWNWERPIPAPGHTNVDFEERVDFRRLHRYRVARTQKALEGSELGAVLCFDNNNIRYLTSSVIGEWSRDKICRYALFTGNADPYLWDFGSAAAHHRLFAPWLQTDHCNAGMLGLRGSVPADANLFKNAAKEIHKLLKAEGVADMPLGVDVVEPPMLFALQEEGIEVRDAQQVLLDARQIKSMDEIILLNMSAAMVDGAYQHIADALKPGVRENDMVALANKVLYEAGSDDGLSHLLLPNPERRTIDSCTGRCVQAGTRMDRRRDQYGATWSYHRQDCCALAQGRGVRLRQRDGSIWPAIWPWPRVGFA